MKRIFYWLAKTDPDIVTVCPRFAQMQQASLGAFVLLTGLFAWLSGSFAITTLFNEYDQVTGKASVSTEHQLISAGIGLVYAFMIMMIDREIVSINSKWSVIPRLFLACIIGVVVAVPIELKILEDPILKSIQNRNTDENMPLMDMEEQRIDAFDAKVDNLEEQLRLSRNRAAEWSEVMQQEATGKKGPKLTGIPGKGSYYEEAERNYGLWLSRITDDSTNLEKERSKRDSLVIDARDKTILRSDKASYGFYAMYKELQLMERDDPTSGTAKLTWGICLLFMLIEIIPALIKSMRTSSEYDTALEARRRINITAKHKESNDAMRNIANSDNMDELPNYVSRMKSRIFR